MLERLPSCGWVTAPSPVTRLPELARHLGLASLTVKRDDLLPALHGGNKVRKLDVLLATPPFKDAPRWASVGAIGSGHLTACAVAAQKLGRTLDAHLFFEPLSANVLENLASVASGPTTLHFHGSRLELGLRQPKLVTARSLDGVPIIPPGGTLPAAVAGVARAGFELAEQIRSGELAAPDVVYCALGTGGTVAGLALGLGLAGVKTEVRAIATVERFFTSGRTVRALIEAAATWLSEHGVTASASSAVPVRVVHGHLGAGYGVATAQSLAAVELMRQEGVPLEPIYTGKAYAALAADAAARRLQGNVLFWSTVRRGPLEFDPAWRQRLPARLSRRLDRATTPSRGRRLVLGGLAALGGAALVARFSGYEPTPGWAGQELAAWEARVLAAAAEVLTGVSVVEGLVIAANVDRFVVTMAPGARFEIHQLMALVEHGTTPLGLWGHRFTNLPPDARDGFLRSLAARGGLLAQAVRGLRDLVLLGTWQDPRTWPLIGYAGPWKAEVEGPENQTARFEGFRAPPGAVPGSGKP